MLSSGLLGVSQLRSSMLYEVLMSVWSKLIVAASVSKRISGRFPLLWTLSGLLETTQFLS